MKKIYLKDIAQELNLSKTAVSLVLNNKGDENKISQETQKRILDFARTHNYRPNQMARGLSRGKSEAIGLIVPNISDAFYANVAHHIELRAKALGYTVVFSSSHEDADIEKELIFSMLNRQVDGLIIASTQENGEDILELKKAGFPFVLFDRHYPDIKTHYVIVDNRGGTKKMTQHLLDKGRRRIGFISIKSGLHAIWERRSGYEEALIGNGLKLHFGLIKELDPFGYQDEMKSALQDMIDDPKGLDAIVFTTHYLAACGLRELKGLGVSVPDEVAIISFDEMGAFDLVDPPITASKQPVDDIGNLTVEILVNTMQGKDIQMENERILDTDLLIRSSCGT
ncbi:MAG: LacI family DNA-binding transcriptional regulator [Bacteroidota bacterium]